MSELIEALTRSVIALTARVRALENAMAGVEARPYLAARTTPKVHTYINDAALIFNMPVEVLLSKSRVRIVAHARQWVMYEAAAVGISTTKIGRELGGMDHTTVMHGIRAEEARRMSLGGNPKSAVESLGASVLE